MFRVFVQAFSHVGMQPFQKFFHSRHIFIRCARQWSSGAGFVVDLLLTFQNDLVPSEYSPIPHGICLDHCNRFRQGLAKFNAKLDRHPLSYRTLHFDSHGVPKRLPRKRLSSPSGRREKTRRSGVRQPLSSFTIPNRSKCPYSNVKKKPLTLRSGQTPL